MRVIFAADHAGFKLKALLKPFVVSLGHDVEDVGADAYDPDDDYVPFMQAAARMIAQDPENTCGILIGASGQGEAIAANRFKKIRAIVYYGKSTRQQIDASGQKLDIVSSARHHNNANVLSLGSRFISEAEAKTVVKKFLVTPFSAMPRHVRRISFLDGGV